MKARIKLSLALIAMSIAFVSCDDEEKVDYFWSGKFVSEVCINNYTDGEIIATFESYDAVDTISLYADSIWYFNIGEYQGSQTDQWPAEEFVTERMNHLRIYRKIGDSIQYLPKKYYDASEDFDCSVDWEFDTHFVTYNLLVTEELFGQ
ncbi:MAG: hypothetical protein IJ057_04835 [Bacteroidales bacterium]|nr:hypothetical protein [Bacteroidales bacterium]